jgi:hypothetical protein
MIVEIICHFKSPSNIILAIGLLPEAAEKCENSGERARLTTDDAAAKWVGTV